MQDNIKLGRCPICAAKNGSFFSVPCDYRKPASSKKYNVEWCEKCNYGQIWTRPSKEEISSFYELDDYYTHTALNSNEKQKESFYDRIRTHISWRLDRGEELIPHDVMSMLGGKTFNLCEIGCGNGCNLLEFQGGGWAVTGIEPDPGARRVAKKSIENVFDGTAEELPDTILNNKYDVVLMSHVLEHCLDINVAVSNAKGLLKNGGLFIVETPNCDSYGFKDYRGGWPWTDIPRHLNFFTPNSLELILAKHGFSVEKTKYRGFCRQFSNSWLENEEEISRAFESCSPEMVSHPNYKLRAWKLLFKSIFSPKSHKYDSVRLIARNE